jgi:hypothetical protein
MNVRDWDSFIRKGRGRTLRLAQLSPDLTAHLDAVSNVVHIEHSYALKSVEKHQMLPAHFPMLDETIDQGAVVRDGDQHLVFLHFDEYVWNRWFRVTVKRCNERRKLFVSTFHKTELGQVRGKLRRLPVLRELKK